MCELLRGYPVFPQCVMKIALAILSGKCTAPSSYAAITAGAVLGLTATSNSMTDVEPSMPSKNGVLFRTGTDSAAWFASDVNLIGNPNVPAYRQNAENYGWWPLISLDHTNRSLSSGSPSGELPFHTFFSPEVPQRNFWKRSRMAAAT